MSRTIMVVGGLVALLAAAPSQAQRVANYAFGNISGPYVREASTSAPPPGAPEGPRFDAKSERELLRWSQVGRCVATKDREASIAYVTNLEGSIEAAATADRLAPAFEACLARRVLKAKGNEALRRAAVADALGLQLAKGS
jgi:hypothetical protein